MTDLSYECSFDTVLVMDNWISPNTYKCKIYFDIETDNGDEQNIAFERMKVLMEGVFQNSLFINMHNPLLQVLAKKTEQRIITLPTEPIVVIMAGIMFYKLSAIVEERISIQQIKLSSSQADNIWVHFDLDFADSMGKMESEYHTVAKLEPWWFKSDPVTSDWFEVTKKDTKMHIQKASWEKDLQWPTEKADAKKQKSKWKPTIIDGGKTQH